MKMEYVLSETDREKIEKYQKQIEEIKQSYIDEYEKYPFLWHELDKQIRNDGGIQVLEKCIENTYSMSVGKYIITVESEEDKERLKEILESLNWRMGDEANQKENSSEVFQRGMDWKQKL